MSSREPEAEEPWYYSLELTPGTYTQGADHRNIALTRELLARVDVEGKRSDAGPARCLDIGTMEALVPILLQRRRASVIAYDRRLRESKLKVVARALGTEFELVDSSLTELAERLHAASSPPPYDLVVFSGVMYHMFDPMRGLAIARGLLRNGGILLVETMASFDDELCMHFNAASRMAPTPVWVPSVPCLDYMLRFLRLEALDATYLGPWEKEGCPPHGRIAVACRGVPEAPAEPGDPRIGGTLLSDNLRFGEFLDWDSVRSDLREVAFAPSERRLVRRDSGTIDLLATTRANEPHQVTDEQVRLSLEAIR